MNEDIAARAKAATEGPWIAVPSELGEWRITVHDIRKFTRLRKEADAEFAAHAREDIPRLLAQLEAVEAWRHKPTTEHLIGAEGSGGYVCSQLDRILQGGE